MSVQCLRCKHYYTTFDPTAPRGCRLYQFKSTQIPAVLVKQESGQDCQGFQKRVSMDEKNKSEKGGIDFNDPKYWG